MQQTLGSLETLWIIFNKLIADAELRTMFCVLDGLDECEDSTLRVLLPRLVGLLAGGMSSSTKGAFKLVIVSRDLHGLQGCPRVRLDPDNDENVVGDIELFVSARVAKLSRIDGFNDDVRGFVQTALLQRAEGTFLWVGFAMHELSQKQTCSQVLKVLENLPNGLPAIYSRMLLQIPTEERKTCASILHWVILALRPLKLQELAVAVGVQPSHPLISLEQEMSDKIALCRPLLKVQESKVGLVHQSARDYLLRKEEDSDVVLEAFRIKQDSTHYELARACLDCVAQSSLQRGRLNLDDQSRSQESPLLLYAALYWPEHATGCSGLAVKLLDFAQAFFQQENSLQINWWESYEAAKRQRQLSSLPLLHKMCYLGIVPWVEALLRTRSLISYIQKPIDERDGNGQTVLYLAVRGGNGEGNEAMVRLLVDSGADVKAKDCDRETVLHWAAEGGNEAIVRLLVDSGADVKAKDNRGKTVLHWAAERGNEAMVRLLVDSGADVEAKDNHGWTVLRWAAEGGNEAIVRLLVERGADVKAKDNRGKTVLHWAAERGNEAMVRLLVDLGADIEVKDNRGKTVLHWAAEGGNEATVRLLVERGADVKAKDNHGKTVLHWAAERGNEATVRLLVVLGADVEAKDNRGMTAL
jgi:ankyrin repeat protein